MEKITWKCLCSSCQRPIQRGKPTLLFDIDRPAMVGISHSACSYRLNNYGHFQMCPPAYLSADQISFLVQFFYRLYNLPGGEEPNRELRWCAAELLRDYPASLANPIASLRKFLDEHKRWKHEWLYDGDLKTDFLRLLGEIQRAAREHTAGVEVDFRT